jgi:[ribosomal protein S5]-alanine N-acetyltransferase
MRDRFPHPYLDEHADAWLAYAVVDPPREGLYAIDIGGEAVGTISVERQMDIEWRCAEIGYWLSEAHWGRGVATEVVQRLTATVWEHTDIIRLFASVFAWNPASMRVLEKAGYVREGVHARSGVKDGVVIDRAVYALVRDTGEKYFELRAGGWGLG